MQFPKFGKTMPTPGQLINFPGIESLRTLPTSTHIDEIETN